jgi:tetratricopeptide (TPR) repeat protein
VLEKALAAERDRDPSAGEPLYRLVSSLGEVQRVLGNHRAAEALLLEGMGLARQIHGAEHGEVALAVYRLARLRLDQGRLEEAEEGVHGALELWRRHLGEDHRYLAPSYSTLARILWLSGRPAEATLWVRRSRVLAGSEAESAGLTLTHAGVLLALGRPTEAEPLARRAWEERDAVSSDPLHGVLAGSTLVEVLVAVGKGEEAAELRGMVAEGFKALPVGCRWLDLRVENVTIPERTP